MEPVAIVAAVFVLLALVGVVLGVRVLRKRERRKKAQTRVEWGDLKGAARLFDEAGDQLRAAELWAESGDRLKAASVHAARKDPDAALDVLRSASPEEIEQGAVVLETADLLQEPARMRSFATLARNAGLHGLSATFFERAGSADDARAARLQEARALAAQGKPLEAAAIYERVGERRAAAAALAEAARRENDGKKKSALAERAAEILKAVGDLAGAAEALAVGGDLDRGVEMLLAANNLAGAGQLLQWHGQHQKAADLFEKSGDLRGAAAAWVRAGDARAASALLEKAGDTIGAARLLLDAHDPKGASAVHQRAGSSAAAAEILAGTGDVDAAVEIYLAAGELDEAVELLCKRGRARDAATLLQSKGETHRASVLLAESGDLFHRAQVLEGKGDQEGAAQAWLDLGQPQEARRVLSAANLTPGGSFLLARACMATSEFGEAGSRFSALLESPPQGIKRVDILYGLARALEGQDRLREAVATLEEVVSAEPHYRDASYRARLLRARGEGKPGVLPSRALIDPLMTPIPLTGGVPSQATPSEWGGMPAQAAMAAQEGVVHPGGVPSRYVVERELGRGAMGVVYRALDSQLGRTVAIKVLDKTADPRVREYFLREARAVAQLIHPHVVTLFDAGLEGSSPYLVMELVEGDDLRTRLQKGPLPLREAVMLAAGVASALDYAHQRMIIHRDVKPENILVGPDGAKLMDFGVAHIMHQQSERRATVIGTPVYMAPEQIKGEPIGGFTDTYALGTVLYECVTGQPPFDPAGALFHHVNTAVPDPCTWRPETPAPLVQIIYQALAKKPEDRPVTAKAFAEVLNALVPTLPA